MRCVSSVHYLVAKCGEPMPGRKQTQHFPSLRLRHILEVTWEDKITNIRTLEQAKSDSIYFMLRLRHLSWLGHVS